MGNSSENYTNQEVTFLDALKVCLKFKYVILAITLAITILGTLFIQLFYKASSLIYSSNFALYYSDLPNIVGADLDFDFKSDKVVNQLKNNEALEGVNIDAFRSVNMGLDFDRDLEKNYASFPYERSAVYYTWSSRQSYFKDRAQAVAFVKALGQVAISQMREKVESVNFANYIKEVERAVSFEQEISYLRSQTNTITAYYEALIEIYGESYIVEEGVTLGNRFETVRFYTNTVNYDSLEETIKAKAYVKFLANTAQDQSVYYSADANYIDKKEQALDKTQKDVNRVQELLNEANTELQQAQAAQNKMLMDFWLSRRDSLRLEFDNLEQSAEEIRTRLDKMRDPITKEIYKISEQDYLNATNSSIEETISLRAKLAECCDALSQYSENYKRDILTIYDAEHRIIYESRQEVVSGGGISLVVSILSTFGIGFVISLIVVFFINVGKKVKESNQVDAEKENKIKE